MWSACGAMCSGGGAVGRDRGGGRVIFNLAVWFAWQVIWPVTVRSIGSRPWCVFCLFVALQWMRVGMMVADCGVRRAGWAW